MRFGNIIFGVIVLCGVVMVANLSAVMLPSSGIVVAPSPRHREGDGRQGIDAVATMAVGEFYRHLFLVWFQAMREVASWQGVIYVGSDECAILLNRTEIATSSVACISLSRTHSDSDPGIVPSFDGKGFARAAKASKWDLTLKVAFQIQSPQVSKRILFVDVDNLATVELFRWIDASDQLFRRTWQWNDGEYDWQSVSTMTCEPDLILPRGRATLGESFNTGMFIITVPAVKGIQHTDDGDTDIGGEMGIVCPSPLECIRAAVDEVWASSVGSLRLRPRLNDQEALRRVLEPATSTLRSGQPHCRAILIPREVQHFAASDGVIGRLAELGVSAWSTLKRSLSPSRELPVFSQGSTKKEVSTISWPQRPGLTHFTQSQKRTTRCAEKGRKSVSSSDHYLHSEEGLTFRKRFKRRQRRQQISYGLRNSSLSRSFEDDDAPNSWLAQPKISGRRNLALSRWDALLGRVNTRCSGAYQKLAVLMTASSSPSSFNSPTPYQLRGWTRDQ